MSTLPITVGQPVSGTTRTVQVNTRNRLWTSRVQAVIAGYLITPPTRSTAISQQSDGS
jgi:hypothetical protein